MKAAKALYLIAVVTFVLLSGGPAVGQIVAGPPDVLMPLWDTFDDDVLGDASPDVQGTSWHHMGWPAAVTADVTGNDFRMEAPVGGYNTLTVKVINGVGKNFTVSVEFEIQRYDTYGGEPGEPDYDPPFSMVMLVAMGGSLTYNVSQPQDAARHERLSFADNVSAATLAPVLGQTYHMWMTGEPVTPGDPNSEFTFAAGLTDGVTTLTLDWTGSGPSQDHVIGMYAASGSTNVTHGFIEVDFDNFSIVPEPATLGLLLIGGLTLLRRKRST